MTGRWSVYWEPAEVAKCQVVCADCHAGRTALRFDADRRLPVWVYARALTGLGRPPSLGDPEGLKSSERGPGRAEKGDAA